MSLYKKTHLAPLSFGILVFITGWPYCDDHRFIHAAFLYPFQTYIPHLVEWSMFDDLRCSCSICWYWWNCWTSQFTRSFQNNTEIVIDKYNFSNSLAVLRVFYRERKNFPSRVIFLFSVSDWIFERSWPRLFKDFNAFQILSSIVICY